jgi:DNA replication ATP-dependent helicase Dna2
VTVFAHTATSTNQPSIRTMLSQSRDVAKKGPHPAFFNAPPTSSKVEILKSGPTPFEIKTGRANAGTDHRAQTMLYTLLTEERYGSDVPGGLLYYTQSEEVVRVPRSRNEVRALVVTRNELASWMKKKTKAGGGDRFSGDYDTQKTIAVEESFLPPTVDNERICKRCYVLDTCMLYRKVNSLTQPSRFWLTLCLGR